MLKAEVIVKIKNYFSQKPEVVAVYLYGSQAREEAKETSDIDLGVVLKGKKPDTIKGGFPDSATFS